MQSFVWKPTLISSSDAVRVSYCEGILVSCFRCRSKVPLCVYIMWTHSWGLSGVWTPVTGLIGYFLIWHDINFGLFFQLPPSAGYMGIDRLYRPLGLYPRELSNPSISHAPFRKVVQLLPILCTVVCTYILCMWCMFPCLCTQVNLYWSTKYSTG